MVSAARFLRHLATPDWWARRRFSAEDLAAIEQAVAASERHHRGELVVAIEGPLPFAPLVRDQTPRQRAVELFGHLGVWDTEENSGVLLYLQLIDRDIEIVADRGIARCVPGERWQEICRQIEADFARQRFREGLLVGIAAITALLAEHFPARPDNPGELPNFPRLL